LGPDCVHLALEVAGGGGDGDDRILVGNHDAELAVGAVTAEGVMSAAPELKAVALNPIDADFGVSFLVIGYLLAGGLFDPFFRDQSLSLPLSFLQVKLAQLGDVFRAELKAIAAE